MDLVDKKDGPPAIATAQSFCGSYDVFHVFLAGAGRVDLLKVASGCAGDDHGERCFAGAGRPVENNAAQFVRLDRAVQKFSLADDVLLSDNFLKRSRAEACGEGSFLFFILLIHVFK